MSTQETDLETTTDDSSVLSRAYRTVTPSYRSRGNAGMDSVGWTMFLGMVVLLVPLLPFLLVVWVVTKLLDAVTGSRDSEE